MKRSVCIWAAVVCLLAGSAIYILYRPISLLMFRWAESLGVASLIYVLRSCCAVTAVFLPDWIIYSLPFALWVSAYMFFIKAVWWRSVCRARHLWLWCVPACSIFTELCQSKGVLPGTFDFTDLSALFFATAISTIIPELNLSTIKGEA